MRQSKYAMAGAAALAISPVFITKNSNWQGKYYLNDAKWKQLRISLRAEEWSPKVLKANANKSISRVYRFRLGFTMSESEAKAFIERDSKTRKSYSHI